MPIHSKSKTNKLIDVALYDDHVLSLSWYVAVEREGKTRAVTVGDGHVVTIPLVLWPSLGHHRAQVDLSRLLVDIFADKARKRLPPGQIEPNLINDAIIAESGGKKIEWVYDEICPHCAEINHFGCCADSPHQYGERPHPRPVNRGNDEADN